MAWWQALVLGFLYYFSDSPWPFGEGYYVLQRPIVAGFLVGLLMGDPVQGTIIGATINLIFLGIINVGGAIPSDMALAGYLGTAIALSANITTEAALAIAVPLGILGTVVWIGKMSINSLFVHWADAFAEKANIRGVMAMNWLPGQSLMLVFKVTIIFAFCMLGQGAVTSFLTAIQGSGVLHGFEVVGGMLPAIGIGLNLKAILKKETMPFLLIGFLLATYFSISIVGISLFGLGFVMIYLFYNKEEGGSYVK